MAYIYSQSILIILLLIKNKPIPSAIILTLLGIFILIISKTVLLSDITFSLPTFSFKFPTWNNFLLGMIYAGIAQLFLTLTNVMIATVVLIKDLFPEREGVVDANTLALNMGITNLISPFFVGMPTCHGSGGLMAQYAFGARTGGSMILEGFMELFLGIFFSETLFLLFNIFMRKVLLILFPIILISGLFCYFLNITVGFFIGLLLYFIFKKIIEKDEN